MQRCISNDLRLDRLEDITNDESRNQIFREQRFCLDLMDVVRVTEKLQEQLTEEFNLDEKPITCEELFSIAEEYRYKTEPDCNDFLEFLVWNKLSERNSNVMPAFDISKVEFDDSWKRDEDEDCPTTIYWFRVPIDWLPHRYEDAVSAELSVEIGDCDVSEGDYDIQISPTNRDDDGNLEDYDWQPFSMPYQNVKELIELGERMRDDD